MRSQAAVVWAIVIGYAASAVMTLAVPLVLIESSSRSPYFPARVLWTELLILIVWIALGYYLWAGLGARDHQRRFGATAVHCVQTIWLYAALSFILMLAHSGISVDATTDRIHWLLQIVLLLVCIIVLALLLMNSGLAGAKVPTTEPLSKSPRELAAILKSKILASKDCPAEHRKNMSLLLNKLQYSLHDDADLRDSPEYLSLSQKLDDLQLAFSNYAAGNDKSRSALAARVLALVEESIRLASQVASAQVRN